MKVWDIQISMLNYKKQSVTITINIDKKADFYRNLDYKVNTYPIHIVCLEKVRYWVLYKLAINIDASNLVHLEEKVIGHTKISLNQPLILRINQGQKCTHNNLQFVNIKDEIYARLNEWLEEEYSNQHLYV